MTVTDIQQDEAKTECTAIVCSKEATMEIVTSVTFTNSEPHVDSVPYCDEHLGWFYRSFSRPSYKEVEVVGINILLDCDTEFARIREKM